MNFHVLIVCYCLGLSFHLVNTQLGNFTLPALHIEWQIGGRPSHLNPSEYRTQSSKYERIVSSQWEVKLGVDLDYHYIETTTTGEMLSAPGCPKSSLGIPWLYYDLRHSVRCYLAGSEGPCGRGQIFTPKPGSRYGYCNCLCAASHSTTGLKRNYDKRLQFCKGARANKLLEYVTDYEYVFIPRLEHCFQLYSQAFCDRGYWLLKTGENQINCVPRQCPADQHPRYHERKLECFKPRTYEHGPCRGTSQCFSPVDLTNDPCRGLDTYINRFGTCVHKVKYNFDD